MVRVIAQSEGGSTYLIETGETDGRRYGRVYDEATDELFEEMLVASIASRGGWVEPTSDRPDLIERLSRSAATRAGRPSAASGLGSSEQIPNRRRPAEGSREDRAGSELGSGLARRPPTS